MGNWQLEVFRMALYIAFPVTTFYYFNQPENFEYWVNKAKATPRFREVDGHREEIQKFIEQYNYDLQQKRLAQLEAKYDEEKQV